MSCYCSARLTLDTGQSATASAHFKHAETLLPEPSSTSQDVTELSCWLLQSRYLADIGNVEEAQKRCATWSIAWLLLALCLLATAFLQGLIMYRVKWLVDCIGSAKRTAEMCPIIASNKALIASLATTHGVRLREDSTAVAEAMIEIIEAQQCVRRSLIHRSEDRSSEVGDDTMYAKDSNGT